ncbi:MAG: ribonuclease HI family protein [Patescibacteria group bacterium]
MKNIIVYTDGGARGNPGPAAAGIVFCNGKKKVIEKHSKYLGDNLTNNVAEYEAAIFALEKFKSRFGKKLAKETKVEIRTDSQLMHKQFKGEYKIKNEDMQKLFIKLRNLTVDFKKVTMKHVSRNYNKDADELVNQELDKKENDNKLDL